MRKNSYKLNEETGKKNTLILAKSTTEGKSLDLTIKSERKLTAGLDLAGMKLLTDQVYRMTNPDKWNEDLFKQISQALTEGYGAEVGVMQYDPTEDGTPQIMFAVQDIGGTIVALPVIRTIYKDLLFSTAAQMQLS